MKRRCGFTLVELLVVIAIIGVLVALLLPAVQAAREAARRLSCTNNLTQLSFALQNYEGSFNAYPAGTIADKGPIVSKPEGMHHNWLSQLLPYMEEQNTYRHIDFGVSVYDEKNMPARSISIPTFACPSEVASRGLPTTSYAGLHHDLDEPIDATNHGVFFLNSAITYEDIRDGSSQTIAIGERVNDLQQDLGWMSGTRSTLRNTGVAINALQQEMRQRVVQGIAALDTPGTLLLTEVGGYSSRHPGGAEFVFCDGHVSFLSESIESAVYQQLGHRADLKLLPRSF